MPLIADIFITTKGRPELLQKSLLSLMENTDPSTYRLTIIDDTGDLSLENEYAIYYSETKGLKIHKIISHSENMGLGPSINEALASISSLNDWYDHPLAQDKNKVAPFICYVQDDILYSPKWLEHMAKMFLTLENQYNLGFASGVECVEHPVVKDLGSMVLKKYIRAANMFGRREYWMSMFPIPRFDPETQRTRAKPNDGMGSGVDWHFIRNHQFSIERTGRNCLVIPGLLVHAGYAQSTWLARELPESERDKEKVRNG